MRVVFSKLLLRFLMSVFAIVSNVATGFVVFFLYLQNLNWEDLLAKKIKPPFVPTIVSC